MYTIYIYIDMYTISQRPEVGSPKGHHLVEVGIVSRCAALLTQRFRNPFMLLSFQTLHVNVQDFDIDLKTLRFTSIL